MIRFAALLALALLVSHLPAPPAALAGNPYAIQGNLEDLDHQGDQIRAVRLPVYVTLRSWEERPFGLRGRLAGTFAINDLANLLDEFEQVKMVSLMPGMEVVFPVGRRHLLRPFLDMGVGTETRSDKEVLLVDGGLRTEFLFAGRGFYYGLEPGFQISNRSGRELENRAAVRPFLTLSARRVLGFAVDGHRPDAGIYFEAGYDFNAAELTSIRSTSDAVRTNLEAGFGLGFSGTRPKIWFIPLPRIRVGYRFGDLEGWRIRLGGDWLTAVTD